VHGVLLLLLPLATFMLAGAADGPPGGVSAQPHLLRSRGIQLTAASQPSVELVFPPEVRLGDTVAIALRLLNHGSQPLVLQLPGRPPAFDVVILGPDGAEIWRRLHGAVTASALMLLQLAPGEARDFTMGWAQVDNAGRQVGPGTYGMRGILPLQSGRLTTATAELIIAR
jgi:hypothetical protein